MRADVADHQRVAVGRGARDGERTDDTAAAALIFHDDRLSEHAPEPIGDRTGDEIDAATRLHRRDDLDRPVRIGSLGGCVVADWKHGDRREAFQQAASSHVVHGSSKGLFRDTATCRHGMYPPPLTWIACPVM